MNSGPTLSVGATGHDVRRLQRIFVMTKTLAPSNITGSFDVTTEQAVKDFQQGAGLTVDGIVGPATWQALPADPDTQVFGRSRVSYGREECVALPPAPGTEIDSGRKGDEDALCQIKFDDPNVILCPALYSTNPGTDIYELPTGVSRASFEQKECAKATGRNAQFLAKYKQSTSCSYTPAILAYGKVADACKIHVDVPATVYRTMEQATHKGVEKMAGVYAHDLIKQTWAGLVSQMANLNPRVIKDGLLYGAMVD